MEEESCRVELDGDLATAGGQEWEPVGLDVVDHVRGDAEGEHRRTVESPHQLLVHADVGDLAEAEPVALPKFDDDCHLPGRVAGDEPEDEGLQLDSSELAVGDVDVHVERAWIVARGHRYRPGKRPSRILDRV